MLRLPSLSTDSQLPRQLDDVPRLGLLPLLVEFFEQGWLRRLVYDMKEEGGIR